MTATSNYRMHSAGTQRGFTVVELMITVLVAAILIAVALPSFRGTIINSNVTQTANALLHDLNTARSEAVRRGTLVAVISNSGSNNWSSGWYIETDGRYAADGTFTGAAPDVILGRNSGVNTANNYSVTAAVQVAGGAGIAPTVGKVIFNSQGNLIPLAQSFNINVCRPDNKPALSKRVTIAASGMATTQTDTSASPAPPC